MPSALKKYRIGITLIMAGISIMIIPLPFLMLHDVAQGPFALWGLSPFIFLIGGFVILGGGTLYQLNYDEAFNIRMWRNLKLGAYEEFPCTKLERAALCGWAIKTLQDAANDATGQFAIRDSRRNDYERCAVEFTSCLFSPSLLPAARVDFVKSEAQRKYANGLYDEAYAHAEKLQNRYLALWDLFKRMHMLPKGPNEKPWDDPNHFRLSLIESAPFVIAKPAK
ncbi:MAG: hypothetical protein Q8Q39_00625 [bacterium]|nr:hypothetical protein [bacterium]